MFTGWAGKRRAGAGACRAACRCWQARRCLVMVPVLKVPWHKLQVPDEVCLGMACPFLMTRTPRPAALRAAGRALGALAPALAHHPDATLPEVCVAAVGDAQPPLRAVLTLIDAEEDSAKCREGTRGSRTRPHMAGYLSPGPRRAKA